MGAKANALTMPFPNSGVWCVVAEVGGGWVTSVGMKKHAGEVWGGEGDKKILGGGSDCLWHLYIYIFLHQVLHNPPVHHLISYKIYDLLNISRIAIIFQK